MDLIPRAGGDEDRLIDTVVYCGINSVVSILGILGNVLLLIIFLHPSLIAHQCLFHSYLKAIALADLLYLLYAVMFNTVVCMGYTDPPVEVATQAMAEFLKVLVTHPQVLSAPSDFLVCLMTLNRLRVILRVKEKRSRDAGRPKPILLQVLSVYILSFVLDSPNWFMFSIQVTESDLSHLVSFVFVLSPVGTIVCSMGQNAGATWPTLGTSQTRKLCTTPWSSSSAFSSKSCRPWGSSS